MATSRYLTAQKISLLVLVRLYCDSVLPSSATIPILSFILHHNIPSTPSNARSTRLSESHDATFPIQTFEDVLQGHASNMPGRTLLDLFLKHMWGINSFDALHGLFDALGGLLAGSSDNAAQDGATESDPERVYLSKTSPLGAFIRRARLEFTRLQFDDAMKLWSAFLTYRAPTAQWTKRLAGIASFGVDITAAEMDQGPGDHLYDVVYGHLVEEEETEQGLSTHDFDRLLEFQLDQIQRLGYRVPDDIRAQLRNMLGAQGVLLCQTHLVKFFDAWKAGDYTSAFDNLHRYYDYAMQTREKIHYQYALLHMAILQADFGCFSEAIATINETITTARENQDMTCLNFSLSWLNHMSKAYPKQMKGAGYMGMLGSERDGLTFLKAKARDAKMYNILGLTLMNEAKLCLSTGESIPRAFEYMYQSSHLNIKENICNYGNQMLLQSSLYLRLGLTHLSGVYCELLLHCYQRGCRIGERMRATSRCALSFARSGRYEEALLLLEGVDTSINRSLKCHQYLFLCIGLVKVKRAIHHTDWVECETLLSSLRPDSSMDPEIAFLLSDAHIEYLVARGHYEQAFNEIESLSISCRDEGADILHRLTTLLMKAKLFWKVGQPERGFTMALRAASVAFKARLMPCLWLAVGLLANVLNTIGEFGAAARLLHAIVPQVLESYDHALGGMLYSHVSDAYVGLAGLDDPSTPQGARAKAANMGRAELYADRARECYKNVESMDGECDQLMKKAIMAKLRGDERLAEEWAQNHNRVWEEGLGRIVDGDKVR